MASFPATGRAVAATLAISLATLIMGGADTASADVAKECDRACLKGHMDRYLDALLKHDASTLPRTADFKAIHNGKPTKLDDEVWTAVDKIAFHQYVMDPAAGQVALFGVAVEKNKRGTLFVRLAVTGGKLSLSETISGERTLDGVPGLISPNPFYDYILPPAQQRSREQLIAIADSYFEGLERHNGKDVPVSEDCRRFEDGVQTSLNPVFLPLACNDFTPFTYMDKTANRLCPIVDVERGLVLGQMVIEVSKPAGPPAAAAPGTATERYMPNPLTGMVMPYSELRGKPRNTLIHELFKVVDGKIVEIQTVRLDRPYGWGGGW